MGNGAAELIKALMERLPGKLGVICPTFEEYPNRKAEETVVFVPPFFTGEDGPVAKGLTKSDYAYTAREIMDYFEDKEIGILALINPDNPSANYIPREDVLKLAAWAEERKIRLIVDESFADFAGDRDGSFLCREALDGYPQLLVVKSISKSFGVPGLRLGVAACADTELIASLKKDVAIWNINSFGEFYMQICEKYRGDYEDALRRICQARSDMAAGLSEIPGVECFPSEANYLMCRLTGSRRGQEETGETRQATAAWLTEKLLTEYNILIKDLSGKRGLDKEYIRLAVRHPKENERLLKAMRELLMEKGNREK